MESDNGKITYLVMSVNPGNPHHVGEFILGPNGVIMERVRQQFTSESGEPITIFV